MGGSGSGNWYRWDSKRCVEDCLHLDVNRLARDGLLRPGLVGTLRWTNTYTGKERASAGFRTEALGDDRLRLWLTYHWTSGSNEADVVLPIRMQTTRPYFGGRRWWFTCPLIVNGVKCNRRVGKLYMGGRYYGCRHCYGLTYRSCQTAHQTDRLAVKWGVAPSVLRDMERQWAEPIGGDWK